MSRSQPRRLVEDDSALGELLRTSLREQLWVPSEAQNFEALLERRARFRRGPWVALAGVSLLAASVFALVWSRPHAALPSAGAEHFTPRPRAEVSVATPRSEQAAPLPSEAPRARAKSVAPKPKASAEQADACAGLARDGRYEDAARCYAEAARSGGMASELALYEKARIEAKALNRAGDALGTLDEYTRRFPRGVLAAEVGMTRIELLIRTGRADAALSAIDVALNGPLGRERAGDLQALRGDLLSARGECELANAAFALARRAGVHPARLEASTKRCQP